MQLAVGEQDARPERTVGDGGCGKPAHRALGDGPIARVSRTPPQQVGEAGERDVLIRRDIRLLEDARAHHVARGDEARDRVRCEMDLDEARRLLRSL